VLVEGDVGAAAPALQRARRDKGGCAGSEFDQGRRPMVLDMVGDGAEIEGIGLPAPEARERVAREADVGEDRGFFPQAAARKAPQEPGPLDEGPGPGEEAVRQAGCDAGVLAERQQLSGFA
jgi:hypothetical protein